MVVDSHIDVSNSSCDMSDPSSVPRGWHEPHDLQSDVLNRLNLAVMSHRVLTDRFYTDTFTSDSCIAPPTACVHTCCPGSCYNLSTMITMLWFSTDTILMEMWQ